MEPTRILVAVRPRMVCESFAEALRSRLGPWAHVVTAKGWRDEVDVAVAAHRHRAEVVVLTATLGATVPPPVARLLDEYPWLTVIALDLGAERACLFHRPIRARALPECSVGGLLDALRGVMKRRETGGRP